MPSKEEIAAFRYGMERADELANIADMTCRGAAGSRPGDIVLDPFMGAGTVALVAKELNRKYLGIELNPDYIVMAEKRLRQEVLPLMVPR